MASESERLAAARTRAAGLLAELRPRTPSTIDWPRLTEAVEAGAAALVRQNGERVVDTPSESHLVWSSVVLATYRALLAQVPSREEVMDALRGALTERTRANIGPYLTARFGIEPDKPAEAFARIAANFKRRGEERFGDAFIYVQDVQDGARSFVNIERCFFNDFFRGNGAPEVTPLFCAMDLVWADELERRDYGVRFDRPTTLARGDDACRFQFSRAAPGAIGSSPQL